MNTSAMQRPSSKSQPAIEPKPLNPFAAPSPALSASPAAPEEDYSDLYPANPFFQPESSGSLGGIFDSVADAVFERPASPRRFPTP